MANSSQIKNDQVGSLYGTAAKVDIRFKPQGSSAPLLTKCPGVKSVARGSTGVYTVTLDEPWKHLIAAKLTTSFGSTAAQRAVLTVHSVTTSPATITIHNVDNTGTVQDIAAGSHNEINLSLLLIDGAN